MTNRGHTSFFIWNLKMSPLFKTFKADANLEKTGILLEYGTTKRDGKEVPVCIRIARAGGANSQFDKVMEHKTKPYKRLIQSDSLDKKVSERIMREVYAETVVLGWENVQNEEGEFLEYNTQNVISIFEQLPDLFTDVVTQSQKQSLFRAEVIEADAKN